MEQYRFGIIGCGMIAQIHAKAILSIPGARLAAVYDAVSAGAYALAQQCGCRVCTSVQEMLEDPGIDIVSICTPSGTHAELAVAAARAGKHVVAEKPLAITAESARAVVRAQEQYGVQICVISQLCFSPAVQAVRKAVAEGAFGKLVLNSLSMRYYRSAEYYQKGGWRGRWATDGGGALMNQGIHGVHLLRYLCGPVRSVRAFSKTLYHSIEVEDTLCAVLEFESGALGTIEASTAVQPGSSRRIELGGTLGSVTLTEDTITQWQSPTPAPVLCGGWEIGAANDPAAVGIAGHRLQLENLLAAIEGRQRLLVDAREGCATVELVLAIYDAARSGETVIVR